MASGRHLKQGIGSGRPPRARPRGEDMTARFVADSRASNLPAMAFYLIVQAAAVWLQESEKKSSERSGCATGGTIRSAVGERFEASARMHEATRPRSGPSPRLTEATFTLISVQRGHSMSIASPWTAAPTSLKP